MNRARRMPAWWQAPAALVVAALFVAPVVWMAAASFKPSERIHHDIDSARSFIPAPFTLANYSDAMARSQLGTTLINTMIVVVVIAGLGIFINGAAAFAFASMRFPGRDWLFGLIVASIILPIEVIVIPLFMTVRTSAFAMDFVGERPWTLAALSLPFAAKAFNIFLLRQHFLSHPRALEAAAMLDGAGWLTVFWRIALPSARPALVTVVLLDFVVHWNDFLWPLVVCQGQDTRTVQLGMGNFFTQPPISWGAIMAYALLITVPLTVVFAIGQRWLAKSIATTGIRG